MLYGIRTLTSAKFPDTLKILKKEIRLFVSSRRLGLSKKLLHKPQVTFSDEVLAVIDLVIADPPQSC